MAECSNKMAVSPAPAARPVPAEDLTKSEMIMKRCEQYISRPAAETEDRIRVASEVTGKRENKVIDTQTKSEDGSDQPGQGFVAAAAALAQQCVESSRGSVISSSINVSQMNPNLTLNKSM